MNFKQLHISFLILFCFVFSCGFTQDILVTKAGDSIRVKIVETGLTEIKYKKYENLSGITYGILKSDVLRIRYENGRVEAFTEEEIANNISPEEKCNCGKSDAANYHGKKDAHFAYGLLLGTYAMIGTAMSKPTPQKGKYTSKLSQHQVLFNDKAYLKCYGKKAKNDLLTMEAWGMVVRVAVPVAIILYYTYYY